MDTKICNRLYGVFPKMSPGIRQCVLSGEITDMFFAGMEQGLCRNIEDALLYYAVQQGYEIAFAIDDKMALRFATPEMQTKYQNIIDRKSEDPQKKAGSIARGASGQRQETNNESTDENAATAAQQVQTNALGKAQQIFDGILNRLLSHSTKSFVILSFAEKILEYGQGGTLTQNSEQKLRAVREWAKAEHGNLQSCSVLIVERLRLEEFNRASDLLVAGLEHRTTTGMIDVPDATEIGAMLVRFRNRYDLAGNTEMLSKKLLAQKLPMFRIIEIIKAKRAAILAKEIVKLNDIFIDDCAEKRKKVLADAEQELAELIGLTNAKEKIAELVSLAKMIRQRQEQGLDTSGFSLHSLLIGNPGTGKTVVARILAKYYYGLGLRRTDNVVEISVADITSAYNPGDASINLRKKIDEAMGGVLFIDEIYQFADDQWLKTAFENVLMKTMEDHRDELTVLGAGYGGESLQNTLKINPGVPRRFKHPDNTIVFPDYNADDLVTITERMLKKDHYTLADNARLPLKQYIMGRMKVGKMENAGGARNLAETLVKNAAHRKEYSIIAEQDIPSIKRAVSVEDILVELETTFIGLQSVKDQIRRIAKRIAYNEREGLVTDRKYNMQFIGNPGTGKTTIARYMSRVFNAVGLLEGTDVIEVAGTALKGSYVGQSKDAVIRHFTRAREEGKVLFIDEAHNLYSTNPAHQDGFSQEVIAQIVQETTAEKNAAVFTILAGYPAEMRRLMDADAGLQRRFPEALTILFPDYSADECLQIMQKRLAQKKLTLDDAAKPMLLDMIETMKQNPKFGNAGSMINLADQLFDEHIMRDEITKVITIEDVEAVR